MTQGYAVTLTVPDHLWATTVGQESITGRADTRRSLRRRGRAAWRTAASLGACRVDRFIMVVAVGGFTRLTESGLSITEWRVLAVLGLVSCASLMPVDELPPASWVTTFWLGFISAVFDNIPLTKLCLEQGGYDWGILAYAVGFGGSMLWFGSSAGVALSSMYPEARSAVNWVRQGWHIPVAYVVGFFVMLAVAGWSPHAPHKATQEGVTVQKTLIKSSS